MNSARVSYLFEQYQTGKATDSERDELLQMFAPFPNKEAMTEYLIQELQREPASAHIHTRDWQDMVDAILRDKGGKETPVRTMWNWQKIAVAASIIIAVGVGSYFMFVNRDSSDAGSELTQQGKVQNDVEPGSFRARLVLADGRIVILDSAMDRELAKQGSMVVMNTDGKLVYQPGTGKPSADIIYNTLTTGKGETYATVLSDGSKVWLNSASSIKFPVAFTGGERTVEITGEAYFEVAKDPEKKFIVVVKGTTTEVLGTHFNVNAYDDEDNIKVTLLEGSVKTNITNGRSAVLQPGEQAVIGIDDRLAINKDADLEQVMAWKNGSFYFNNTNIEVIMRQAARWYDVEVVYKGDVRNEYFGGTVPRNERITKLIKALELTQTIKVTIEGKKIIIRPAKQG